MESPKKNSKPSRPEGKDTSQDEKQYMRYYALAFELVVMNLALIVGGYFLDDFLSSSPVIILIATFLSMGGTIWLLLKSLK
ncbi:MAG: AtpZ/AtpI family protein [Ekhidna sp.]|uniref:AtpZ/AtpI family protein n=1 Tax=Ekhidna sp. TaxID=2608089 RepID=UPI0032EC4474